MKRPWKIFLTVPIFGLMGMIAYAHWPLPGLPADTTVHQIVVIKSLRSLELIDVHGENIRQYRIALSKDANGAKCCRGDFKTPEGNFIIDYRNPNSLYHLSLHISYPNQEDRDRAQANGCDPGGDIMIHGLPNGIGLLGRLHRLSDWTYGCIALTNSEIEEIWKIVPNGTPIEIRP